jgi:diguanylate cyclase (GGDEF)-like protein
MELHRVLADACEQTGDPRAALACMRQAHALYEQLVGRSARARYIALEVGHQLATAQRERDVAVNSAQSIEDDRHRLADLNAALQAQIAQTELLHAQLRDQALSDPLTGLHNRRYLFEVAPGMLDLARRQAKALCVVLIDLDHFKLLNDTFGHQAGDRVLRRFATLMREMLRRSDVVCRHGGEEFVAVLPDIDGDGAQALLARLLEAVQSLPPEPGQRRTPNASFSAGIALFPRHGVNLEQLLSRADRALYAAKNGGRARIEQVSCTTFSTLS